MNINDSAKFYKDWSIIYHSSHIRPSFGNHFDVSIDVIFCIRMFYFTFNMSIGSQLAPSLMKDPCSNFDVHNGVGYYMVGLDRLYLLLSLYLY